MKYSLGTLAKEAGYRKVYVRPRTKSSNRIVLKQMLHKAKSRKVILRMQDMLQNKTQVETVHFRLYFKVIVRQNGFQILHMKINRSLITRTLHPRCTCVEVIYTS